MQIVHVQSKIVGCKFEFQIVSKDHGYVVMQIARLIIGNWKLANELHFIVLSSVEIGPKEVIPT